MNVWFDNVYVIGVLDKINCRGVVGKNRLEKIREVYIVRFFNFFEKCCYKGD